MIQNDTTKSINITDLIEQGKENSFTAQNTNIWYKDLKSDITLPLQNIFRESYRPLIMRYCQEVTLDKTAVKRYKYNPKLLSYDVYGTVDLWHMILWLNNLTSILEFKKNKLLIFSPTYIDVLVSILNNENDNILENNLNPHESIE